MRIHVSQIYIEPGVSFPFTHVFQKYLGGLLTEDTTSTDAFCQRFGNDYSLVFNVSAKHKLTEPEIKGPTVFKREKTVEYTIFLPCSRDSRHEEHSLTHVLEVLLGCIDSILTDLGMSTHRVAGEARAIAHDIVSSTEMIRLH